MTPLRVRRRIKNYRKWSQWFLSNSQSWVNAFHSRLRASKWDFRAKLWVLRANQPLFDPGDPQGVWWGIKKYCKWSQRSISSSPSWLKAFHSRLRATGWDYRAKLPIFGVNQPPIWPWGPLEGLATNQKLLQMVSMIPIQLKKLIKSISQSFKGDQIGF